MDVRIAYAVNLDKVPEKVSDMLHTVEILKANRLVITAAQLLEFGNYKMASSLIEDARQVLAKADRALGEAQMILDGYTQAVEEEQQPAIMENAPQNESIPQRTGDLDAD